MAFSDQDSSGRYIPSDIVRLIAKKSDRASLKNLCLVSRDYLTWATYYLFNRVYISPRELDLDAFNNIAGAPPLASCVKELIFDVSFCAGYSTDSQLLMLANSTRSRIDSFGAERLPSTIDDNSWRNIVVMSTRNYKRPEHRVRAYSRYAQERWFTGFRQYWEKQCQEERKHFEYGTLYRSLLLRLREFHSLRSVVVHPSGLDPAKKDSAFPSLPGPSGSPLCRQWPLFYPRPRTTKSSENSTKLLIKALSDAERRVLEFRLLGDYHVGRLLSQSKTRIDLAHHIMKSLSQTEHLGLHVSTRRPHRAEQTDVATTKARPILLGSAARLKFLKLCIRRKSKGNWEYDTGRILSEHVSGMEHLACYDNS